MHCWWVNYKVPVSYITTLKINAIQICFVPLGVQLLSLRQHLQKVPLCS